MQAKIALYLPDIIKLRQQLHQHPELAYQEIFTANLVAKTLQEYGYQPQMNIGKTGVVAILDSGKPGRTVALRADMDALPIHEANALSYASQHPGVMHACGHDGHTATLLLLARLLRDYRAKFCGKIKFIFQPAEEGGHGAAAMIADGVLTNPNVDAIFAFHNAPKYPKHQILLRAGCMFAGSAFFNIQIEGKGGHASAPHRTVDPILVGSVLVQNLQSIISRNLEPQTAAVLSITQFNAGTAHNIIPVQANLSGCIRFLNENDFEYIKLRIAEISEGVEKSFGAKITINYIKTTPPLHTTAAEVKMVADTASQLFAEQQLTYLSQPRMATEDFAFYLQKIPGCYVMIGTGEDKAACHSPDYQFNDEIITTAALLLAQTTINYLNKND